ncbi:MAG: 30S ribosome-binding factor RbfA [Planctomycetes bacterium]|nr:30S ribosome-binding factor RbfA [Planctomycetota bacterium]
MSHRQGRVAHIIRDIVSDAISNRISDPRVSRFTSVTRVELSPDLRQANVYVSVMGTPIEGETTMKGLDSARGMIQTRVARNLDMRQAPMIRLILDLSLKRGNEILQLLSESGAGDKPQSEKTRKPPAASDAPAEGDDE